MKSEVKRKQEYEGSIWKKDKSRFSQLLSALPEAPRNLRVLRCVNKDSLLLSWTGPEIDEMGRNNGHIIKGYKVEII